MMHVQTPVICAGIGVANKYAYVQAIFVKRGHDRALSRDVDEICEEVVIEV